jgi:tetratricopeptide (TPR) repeat protein
MDGDALAARFPGLQPGKQPSLGNIYGIGSTLVGRRDFDPETGTYVKTNSLSIFFIPLVAIGAYRVADAPGGGWYCLGKVPLSNFARVASVVAVLVLVGAIGGIWWRVHTESPDYVAGLKLEDADRAAAAGQGGAAARLCREVMDGKSSRTEEAKRKLASLIEDPPGAPSEAAAIYAVAVDLQRESRCPVPNLFVTGKAVAARFAEADPAAALDLLELIAPFADDVASELALRRGLLEKLHSRQPNDLEIASRLAAVYEAQGEQERCEKLLLPFEPALGTGEGAAILGRIHAARGRFDRAYALLKPYVSAHLPAFRDAEQAYSKESEAAQARAIALLQSEKAPGFDYQKCEQLPKAMQALMIQEYIGNQLKLDPSLREARKRLMAERAAIPATLELGLVQLQRGEAFPDPALRKAELEAAERTFLSIQGFARESDEYRLNLGRVYYWLGKQAEGKKLFEELLTARGRSPEAMVLVAQTLRNLGDFTEARLMVESAYEKENDIAAKQRIAGFRALFRTNIDEEILWLSRSNTENADVQASLASARGHKARTEGNDEEAKSQYLRAIELYDKMPESAATLNNSAIVHFALFRTSQDRSEFTRGMEKLDRAISLQPSDSILLMNAASSVSEGAFAEVIGPALDFRVLKQAGGWDLLAYLTRGPEERKPLVDRLLRHPGMVKSRSYCEKLFIISPKHTESYSLLADNHGHARDLQALKTLLARLEKTELDHGENEKRLREFLSGESDAKFTPEMQTVVTRAAESLAAARGRKDRTFAAAVGQYIRAKHGIWAFGKAIDVDELVSLAEEAHAALPSDGTYSDLGTALALRAHSTLAREDKDYAALADRTRRYLGSALIYYVLAENHPARSRAAANPDLKRLAEIVRDEAKRDPEGMGPRTWLFLRAVDPPAAEALAPRVKANELLRVRRTIDRLLNPLAASGALEEYAALVLEGKEAEARKVFADLKSKKMPLP